MPPSPRSSPRCAAASGVPVLEAFVDVHGPYVDDVASVSGDAVVVPLLLAPGYHVHVDIARAVAPPPPPSRRALGPSPLLTSLLMDRLRAAGARPGDAVVLAAAGSSDDASDVSVRAAPRPCRSPGAARDRCLRSASRTPSSPTRSRGSAPSPSRVVVASYLLATGHFHRRMLAAGADLVTAPLLDEASPTPGWWSWCETVSTASRGPGSDFPSRPRRFGLRFLSVIGGRLSMQATGFATDGVVDTLDAVSRLPPEPTRMPVCSSWRHTSRTSPLRRP